MAKKARSAAQKAATARMLAANRAKRGHGGGGHKSSGKRKGSSRAGTHVVVVRNPGHETTMMGGGAPREMNPKRKGKRRRRNPAGGVVGALWTLTKVTGGVIVSSGLSKLADMYIPLGNGALAAIEASAAIVLGGVTYMLSPAFAAGVFSGFLIPAGSKVYAMLVPAKGTTPAKTTTTPAASSSTGSMGAVEVVRLGPGQKIVARHGGQAMGRIELAMGAIQIVPDNVRTLDGGRSRVNARNVMVSGADVDRARPY